MVTEQELTEIGFEYKQNPYCGWIWQIHEDIFIKNEKSFIRYTGGEFSSFSRRIDSKDDILDFLRGVKLMNGWTDELKFNDYRQRYTIVDKTGRYIFFTDYGFGLTNDNRHFQSYSKSSVESEMKHFKRLLESGLDTSLDGENFCFEDFKVIEL